jgi:hypothetical protein
VNKNISCTSKPSIRNNPTQNEWYRRATKQIEIIVTTTSKASNLPTSYKKLNNKNGEVNNVRNTARR